MKYHLVIIKKETNTVNYNVETEQSGAEYEVKSVADCFVNPVTKDLNDIIKELCYGRPSNVQQVLQEALNKINNGNK